MQAALLRMVLLFVAVAVCSGCVTKRLWEDKALNEPSPQPNLHFYYSEPMRDVIVVYDEICEPSPTVKRRAYHLDQFSKKDGRIFKPVFIDVRATNHLQEIPVIVTTNSAHVVTNAFAVIQEDRTRVLVKQNGAVRGPYELPVYPSGFYRGAQIALTPLAVVADTAIVGTVVGAIVAYAWASGATH